MSTLDFIVQYGDRIVLFIIPGLIFVSLFCYLTGNSKENGVVDKIINYSAISVLSYFIGNIILQLINRIFYTTFSPVQLSDGFPGNTISVRISTEAFISATIISIILCLFAVYINDRNICFKFARLLHLTHKTDNNSVWISMLDENDNNDGSELSGVEQNQQLKLVVRDYVTGNTYSGELAMYSDGDANIQELLLKDVTVWKNGEELYSMKKIYLCRKPSEFSIEFDISEGEKSNEK